MTNNLSSAELNPGDFIVACKDALWHEHLPCLVISVKNGKTHVLLRDCRLITGMQSFRKIFGV